MRDNKSSEPLYVSGVRDRRLLLPPYSDCSSNGPVFHKKTGRYFIFIYFPEGSKVYTQYARYILSVKIGRRLLDAETVDHVDGDKTNDFPDNLESVSFQENCRRFSESVYATKVQFVQITCPACDHVFLRRKSLITGGLSRKFCACSHRCKGIVSKKLQLLGPEEKAAYESSLSAQLAAAVGVLGRSAEVADNVHQVPVFSDWSTPLESSTFAGVTPHKSVLVGQVCKGCGTVLYTPNKNKKYCTDACRHQHKGTDPVPTIEAILERMDALKSFVQVGRSFGVSDNAVRKWLIKYGRSDLLKKKVL